MEGCLFNLVSDIWTQLACNYHSVENPSDERLHVAIVDNLMKACFYVDEAHSSVIREKLLLVMPQFHAHVRNTTVKRKIKLVKEQALSVNCDLGPRLRKRMIFYFISDKANCQLKFRYDERNLLFHAALIVLFSMEPARYDKLFWLLSIMV